MSQNSCFQNSSQAGRIEAKRAGHATEATSTRGDGEENTLVRIEGERLGRHELQWAGVIHRLDLSCVRACHKRKNESRWVS